MAEITLQTWRPNQLSEDEWLELQGIARAALADTLDPTIVSEDDIAYLVSLDDPRHFQDSHTNSKLIVGERFNANQAYFHGRVAVAVEGGTKPVGFGSSYWNTSYRPPEGTQDDSFRASATLLGKLATPHSYFNIRDLFITPEEQYVRRGIGTRLARRLLRHSLPWQRVTTYMWPELDPDWMQPMLERHGFSPTGDQAAPLFGPNKPPVTQRRMQAPSPKRIIQTLSTRQRS